jgi:hypothetical protein
MEVKICQQTNVAEVDNSAIKCDGYTSDDCIIHEQAIAYLALPVESSIKDVVDAILLSLVDARNRVLILEENLEAALARISEVEIELESVKERVLTIEIA